MIFTAMYGIPVGVLMLVQWIFFLGTSQVAQPLDLASLRLALLIPHPWAMTFKEMYIDYQPWILLIYIIIFLSPVAVSHLMKGKKYIIGKRDLKMTILFRAASDLSNTEFRYRVG